MNNHTELKRLAEAAIVAMTKSDADECNADLMQAAIAADDAFTYAASPDAVLALIAENERQAAKIEQVRSRSVSLDCSPDGVIPNALNAWGRAVPQHLPYDFSGNPGASATQYCNGWNDAGGYWKAHCVDIQDERDQLKAENEALRKMLVDASEEVATWGAYASEYFQEKHNLAGCVAKFHDAAIGKVQP